MDAAVRVARGPSAAGVADDRAGSVRILHLSDLHFTPDTKWQDHLDPLLLDLRHADLGCERIAVWHHAVLHVDGMKEVDFVGHLTKAGVRLVLHGDVHEANPAANPFQWPGLTILGARAFGAAPQARPESIPGLYQVIELRPGNGPGGFAWARVHTRARARTNGPWEGWYHWPAADDGKARVAHIDVDLNTRGPHKPTSRSVPV